MIKIIKEGNHIASMLPQKGQSLFTYEVATKKIETAEINDELVIANGFLYVLAINKKNAAKKFLKLLTRRYQ
jgi:hypothetical protein